MVNIAFFVSPHGFGHAARACAVIQSLAALEQNIHFEIFSTIPDWFFSESLTCSFTVNHENVDVGMVQSTPLDQDIPATLRSLSLLYPAPEPYLRQLEIKILEKSCQLIVCDISPLGIQIAKQTGIKSILIENFTWDWIYEGYLSQYPGFDKYIFILRDLFSACDVHIQTEPLCHMNVNPHLSVHPISRIPRTHPSIIRADLGIREDQKMILVTMGGIQENLPYVVDRLSASSDVLVIPGAGEYQKRIGNLVLLPYHSTFFHPDLIHTCDAVIGKAGYSTIAEAYYAGIPFGYIPRANFREAPILEKFIKDQLPSISLSQGDLISPHLPIIIDQLLHLKPAKRNHLNGSLEVARYISDFLKAL